VLCKGQKVFQESVYFNKQKQFHGIREFRKLNFFFVNSFRYRSPAAAAAAAASAVATAAADKDSVPLFLLLLLLPIRYIKVTWFPDICGLTWRVKWPNNMLNIMQMTAVRSAALLSQILHPLLAGMSSVLRA
jgi:hypothetical protein